MSDLIDLKTKDKITYDRPYPSGFKNGKWHYNTIRCEARVMAAVEGYAMLRKKGGMPYVESIKDLQKWRVQ